MCWLTVCPAGKDIPEEYIDRAQKINGDGYGVTWYDTKLHIFKSMDYTEFKDKLATLTDYQKVVHLRLASIGSVTIDNVHPFSVNSSYLFHNGTMSSFRSNCATSCSDDSDTKQLAHILTNCKYSHISDVLPLVQHITGKTNNKLVFHEEDGAVTIVNKELGNEEDGIWYSNTYHVEKAPSTYSTTSSISNYYSYSGIYGTVKSTHKTKVFVYGTLKANGHNHHVLGTSKMLGTGLTAGNYAMIGKDMSYPYLLSLMSKDEGGLQILGEVYECDEDTMRRLDTLEGVPYHYLRKQISVLLNGTYHIVTTYMKTNVTSLDLSKPFINEFPVNQIVEDDSKSIELKPIEELIELSTIELCNYLDDLESFYYGKPFNSHKNYTLSSEEVLEELELMYEIIEDVDEDILGSTYYNYIDN